VIHDDADTIIIISILPCEAMVIIPSTIYEAAFVAYEIGNKHLPLFFQDGELLIPFDAPSFRLLEASGFVVRKENRKLSEPLRTTVNPHAHSANSSSLFSRILQFTNTAPNE
jgi:urease accessory protein